MNSRILLILTLAAAASLPAQEKKPAKPAPAEKKVPVHSPEQSTLNTNKQDIRNKDELEKKAAEYAKAIKKSDAANREIERFKKGKSTSTDEDKARLEKVKKTVDENVPKELKDAIDDSKAELEDTFRKARAALRERNKGGKTQVKPVPEAENAPGNVENIQAPSPIPVLKAPIFSLAPISADLMVGGMVRDPKDPERELPKSDPRTRTFLLMGTARFRQPGISAMDADELDILFKEGEAPGSPAETKGPPSVDPVKAGAKKSSPIERITARGRVRFMFVDKDGRVQAGRGGSMIYEEKTGLFILKDWPEAEFDNKIIRSLEKGAVIRLSLNGTENSSWTDCEVGTLNRELTPDDLPRDRGKPVPASDSRKPAAARAPSPAPR